MIKVIIAIIFVVLYCPSSYGKNGTIFIYSEFSNYTLVNVVQQLDCINMDYNKIYNSGDTLYLDLDFNKSKKDGILFIDIFNKFMDFDSLSIYYFNRTNLKLNCIEKYISGIIIQKEVFDESGYSRYTFKPNNQGVNLIALDSLHTEFKSEDTSKIKNLFKLYNGGVLRIISERGNYSYLNLLADINNVYVKKNRKDSMSVELYIGIQYQSKRKYIKLNPKEILTIHNQLLHYKKYYISFYNNSLKKLSNDEYYLNGRIAGIFCEKRNTYILNIGYEDYYRKQIKYKIDTEDTIGFDFLFLNNGKINCVKSGENEFFYHINDGVFNPPQFFYFR